jgi:hypothetical protein
MKTCISGVIWSRRPPASRENAPEMAKGLGLMPDSIVDPDGTGAFWRDALALEVERNFNPTRK